MALGNQTHSNAAAADLLNGAPDELAAKLERIVVGAVAITVRALANAVPGFDLTIQQWRAILIIGRAPAGVRVSAVAAQVGVTLPATGRALRRLAARGLIDLATDETDRRATVARLTPSGHSIREAVLAYRRVILLDVATQVLAEVVPGRTPPGASDLDAIARLLDPAA